MNETRYQAIKQAIKRFIEPLKDALETAGYDGELTGETLHIPNKENVEVRVIVGFNTTKPCAPLWSPQEIIDQPYAIIRDMTPAKNKTKRMNRTDSIVNHVGVLVNSHH